MTGDWPIRTYLDFDIRSILIGDTPCTKTVQTPTSIQMRWLFEMIVVEKQVVISQSESIFGDVGHVGMLEDLHAAICSMEIIGVQQEIYGV